MTDDSMTNTIYWVRHGESESNLRREFATWRIDLSLTDKGRLQAAQTGDYLQDMQIDEIFCSPLRRAKETAAIIGRALSQPVTEMSQFREVSVGELEGLPINGENRQVFLAVRRAWQDGDLTASVPGGESYQEIWARTYDGIFRILRGKRGLRIIVVAHMALLSHTIADLCPSVDVEALRQQESFNCSITEMTMRCADGRWRGDLVRWVDVSHLSGAAAELISFSTSSGRRES